MGPRPYSDRSVLPRDSSNSSVSIESDTPQTTLDTSPGSISVASTPSPIDHDMFLDINGPDIDDELPGIVTNSNACYPTPNDSMPFDHAFPDFIRQLTNERNLANVHSLKIRVISRLVSLQRMSLFTINLRELDLEGSELSSLRDIGCNLKNLQVLKVGNCQLDSLDGTFGLTSLRQLYAQRNYITDVSPCSNLPHIQHIDISSNRIRNISYAGFLSVCRKLKSIVFEGNPATHIPEYRNHVKTILPQIKSLDGIPFDEFDNKTEIGADNNSKSLEDDAEKDSIDYNDTDLSSNEVEDYNCPFVENYSTGKENNLPKNGSDISNSQLSDNFNRRDLLSLRRRRDDDNNFRGATQARTMNINIEKTEAITENLQPSHSERVNGELTFPPLGTNEKDPRKFCNIDKETPLGPGRRTEMQKTKSGEKCLAHCSSTSLEVCEALTISDSFAIKMGTIPRSPVKLGRPASGCSSLLYSPISNDSISENSFAKKRPFTAGSEHSSVRQVDDNENKHILQKSLTSGLPICGNLAVALRNRKRQQQEAEESEMKEDENIG